MTNVLKALQAFNDRTVGALVRGQRVASIGLSLEPPCPEYAKWRYILECYFHENMPPETDSVELALVKRVTSTIPFSARICTNDLEQLVRWLDGSDVIDGWLLSDELPQPPGELEY